MSAHLEIACFNAESALVAQQAGADRIEFCESYELGGITPDFDTLADLRQRLSIPVFVMIRPRSGDFVYSNAEFDHMRHDIERFKAIADGFVFGILTSDAKIDTQRNTALVKLTSRPCTFHRAFDEVADAQNALEDAISCGFQNILTSGGTGNALANTDALTNMIRQSAGRVTIMPGGGIRSGNIGALLQTTATWFHSAALDVGSNIASAEEIQMMRFDIGKS